MSSGAETSRHLAVFLHITTTSETFAKHGLTDRRHMVTLHLIWVLIGILGICQAQFTPSHLRQLRLETRELFDHAWSSYLDYGFPSDEVLPMTCEAYGHNIDDVFNTVQNDASGNFSSTLLDNLDSLIIFERWDDLRRMLAYLKREKDTIFHKNVIVQVFEVTIRSVGGLLSAHLFLSDVATRESAFLSKRWQPLLDLSRDYDGFLLDMAHDLASRLLPAFQMVTHVPYPRINLATGLQDVPLGLQNDNCLAGATTPVLEFTLLSRLTGDPTFEYYSQQTFWKMWSSRSELNFIPMTIDPLTNTFKDSVTGIGASVDSFYEYAAKSSVVLDDDFVMDVFQQSYKALRTHSAMGGGPNDGYMLFPNVAVGDGSIFSTWIDSLSAFFPGLQVLTGQLTDAVNSHLMYMKIWDYFDSIPERWTYMQSYVKFGTMKEIIPLQWYPLRPEFVESTYYLYRATRDPMYLNIGKRILHLFQTKYWTKCGFNGLQDVRTGEFQNKMESFVMGETLKYLYLLFDTNDENILHGPILNKKNWVFSTEAHPLWFNKHIKPTKTYYTPSDPPVQPSQTRNVSLKKLWKKQMAVGNYYPSVPMERALEFSAFYRNVTKPEVWSIAIPGIEKYPWVKLRDPFVESFSHCEVKPAQFKAAKSFMSSHFFSIDELFHADQVFSKSLVRPPYLPNDLLDGSYIELDREFFDTFTLFMPRDGLYLQCPRPAQTEKTEVIISDVKLVNEVEVSRIHFDRNYSLPKQSEFMENDLWVPELVGLRLTFEHLAPNRVDSRNIKITSDFLSSLHADLPSEYGTEPLPRTAFDFKTAMRLIKINGIHIGSEEIVWTLPFSNVEPEGDVPPLFAINLDGRLLFQGTVIENFRAWYG